MYDRPIAPETWVHNLEHGGVVILYRCDRPCPELLAELRQVYETFPRDNYGAVKLVVAPDTRIATQLALLAWDWLDQLAAFDRDRILRFYRGHVDRGPEDVP